MATFVIVNIDAPEYELFRNDVGPNFANTFDQWRKVIADGVEEAQRRGDTIVDIRLKHNEFAAYCLATGQECDANALYRFMGQVRQHGQYD